MSRCFPYTPAMKRTAEETPIGSIKLEKEGERTKEEQKRERKREKKEKKGKEKREKKEKKHNRHKKTEDQKERGGATQENSRSLDGGEQVLKKRKYDEVTDLPEKSSKLKVAGKCPVEQLEGSGLSEEHGLPSFKPEPCGSSESTENSNKSRKLESAGAAPRSNGTTILRLKLPSKEQKSPDPTGALPSINLPIKNHSNPTSVPASAFSGVKLPLKNQNEQHSVPSSAFACVKFPLKKHNELDSVPSSAIPGVKLPLKKHNELDSVPSSAFPGVKLPVKKHNELASVPSSASSGINSPLQKHRGAEPVSSKILPGTSLLPLKKLKGVEPVSSNTLSGTSLLPLKKHKGAEPVPSKTLAGTSLLPLRKHAAALVASSGLPRANLTLKNQKDPEPVRSSAIPPSKLPLISSGAHSGLIKETGPVPRSGLPGLKCKHAPLPITIKEKMLCSENKVPECGPCNEEPCFSARIDETSRQKEAGRSSRKHSDSRSSSKRRRSENAECQLNDLLSSLNTDALQHSETHIDDLDWLFGSSRHQHSNPVAKSCKADSIAEVTGDIISAVATAYQPMAPFMPEFSCFQLPYVCPF